MAPGRRKTVAASNLVDSSPTPIPRPMSAWPPVPQPSSWTATDTVNTVPAAHMCTMTEQQKVPDWVVVDACVAEIHPFVPHRFDAVFSTIAKVSEHWVTLSNEIVYPVPGLHRTQGDDVFVLMSVSDPQVCASVLPTRCGRRGLRSSRSTRRGQRSPPSPTPGRWRAPPASPRSVIATSRAGCPPTRRKKPQKKLSGPSDPLHTSTMTEQKQHHHREVDLPAAG